MTCELVSTRGALFVLWGKPTRASLEYACGEIRLAAEQAGGPIVYITRVPVDAPAPEAEERRYLGELMPRILDWCSTYHVVMEGSGFVNAMKRSVLVGMFQIRWRQGTFFVHSSCGEVIHNVSRENKLAVANVLALAERKQLLTKPAPSSLPPGAHALEHSP